jgi:hypothetical protein
MRRPQRKMQRMNLHIQQVMTMRYKTIVLALLEANPTLHSRLKAQRQVLATMDRLALELRSQHHEQMRILQERSPASDPRVISSQALELALEELRASPLLNESEDNDHH